MRSYPPARSVAPLSLTALTCFLLASSATLCLAQDEAHPPQSPLADGVRLLRDGHPSEARQQLDLAVKAAPRSADALTWRGICENELQQYPAAAADFEAALRLDRNTLPAHYNFALTLIRLHRPDDAIAQLRIVVAAQPDAVQALYNLAVLLESNGSFAEAVDMLRKARAYAPTDDGIALHLLLDELRLRTTTELAPLVSQLAESTSVALQRDAGTALLEEAQFPDAVTLLTAAREHEPTAPGIELLLARALIGDRQDGAAIRLLNSAASPGQEAGERAYLLGLAYLDQGATSDAARQFQVARDLNPQDARTIYHLALLAAATPERREEAAQLLRSSLALNPTNEDYALSLARLLLVQDKAEEAQYVLLQMKISDHTASHNSARQHALLGVALAALHQTAKAIPQLQQALAQDPSLALAHNVLGFCYLQQGDYGHAAASYGRASELDPARALYAHDAALAFERANRSDEATRFAERAVQLNDASADDRTLLGKLYSAADRKPEALQQLLRAAALDPDSDAACYLLARTYQQQGDRQQALAWSAKLASLKQKQNALFSLSKKIAAQAIHSSRLLEGGSYGDPPPGPR